ncbi:MAG TPA: hypothetical protein VJT09_19520 [Pyrinomonadaceae bacterium]|nr:hypothetical protein [Pyrinomonadaceae bacterium]
MKKVAVRLVVALMVCALVGGTALADKGKIVLNKKGEVKSKTITIGVDFIVGDTLVKKGTYKFSFDTKSKELTVMAKDKEVVAKTVAHLEPRQEAASGADIVLAQKGANQVLVSIAFQGDGQNIVLDGRGAETAEAR